MSTQDFVLDAKNREVAGKGASRRLRRESGLVPAIIYGDNKPPQMITLEHKDLAKQMENEAFYSQVININVDGTSADVILKDLQRHPAKAIILHADFLRVSKTQKLTTRVPLHFINEATSTGVKLQGGKVTHHITDVEISCLASDLPAFIEVDLADVEIGQIVHISDLTLPSGVESVALAHGTDHDLAVASIAKSKGASEDDDENGSAESEGGEE